MAPAASRVGLGLHRDLSVFTDHSKHEAREQRREVLRVNPDYSLEHRRKMSPYKNPGDFEGVVEGLRKACLPEQ